MIPVGTLSMYPIIWGNYLIPVSTLLMVHMCTMQNHYPAFQLVGLDSVQMLKLLIGRRRLSLVVDFTHDLCNGPSSSSKDSPTHIR